jgi:hypothetical protein
MRIGVAYSDGHCARYLEREAVQVIQMPLMVLSTKPLFDSDGILAD